MLVSDRSMLRVPQQCRVSCECYLVPISCGLHHQFRGHSCRSRANGALRCSIRIHLPQQPLLASDKVRHVGEAIAVVVAESRYEAQDAAELVTIDLDPLPGVVDAEAALEAGAPLVHEQYRDKSDWRSFTLRRAMPQRLLLAPPTSCAAAFIRSGTLACRWSVEALLVHTIRGPTRSRSGPRHRSFIGCAAKRLPSCDCRKRACAALPSMSAADLEPKVTYIPRTC